MGIRLAEAYSGVLRAWLQTGRVDLPFLYGDAPEAGLAKQALLDDQLVLETHTGYKRTPSKLALKSLAGWPLVLPGREHGLCRLIDDACEPLGIELGRRRDRIARQRQTRRRFVQPAAQSPVLVAKRLVLQIAVTLQIARQTRSEPSASLAGRGDLGSTNKSPETSEKTWSRRASGAWL